MNFSNDFVKYQFSFLLYNCFVNMVDISMLYIGAFSIIIS